MDKLRSISFTKKAIIVTTGVAAISVGAYLLYRRLRRGEKGGVTDFSEPGGKAADIKNIQPSENVDDTDIGNGKKILVLGLEKSGKSCLLSALTNEQDRREYQPTHGFNVVCITNINQRLDIMEIGGSERYREYWSKFVNGTDLLMYVIDSSDGSLLQDTLATLEEVLQLEALLHIPVIIVLSKRDKDLSVPINDMIEEIKQKLVDDRFEYASVQVQCGGAPSTEGVSDLQEQITQVFLN